MTISINFGGWGGVYKNFSRQTWRVCFGFVALTIYWFDLDDVLVAYLPKRGFDQRRNHELA